MNIDPFEVLHKFIEETLKSVLPNKIKFFTNLYNTDSIIIQDQLGFQYRFKTTDIVYYINQHLSEFKELNKQTEDRRLLKAFELIGNT